MPTMHSIIPIIAFVALLSLLYGCVSGVPQDKYDALAASCESAKTASASALAAEVSKSGAANAKLSTCTSDRQSLQSLLDVKEQENVPLRVDAAVLAKARVKTDRIVQYNLAEEYYLDAFGAGKIPNTARIKKVDAQVSLLNDATLRVIWANVKNCQTSTGCESAKALFSPYIGNQTEKLALEAAAIVGAAN
jgi:hypothetical protein